ncbi:uncharacterized protein LOC130815526 [Amaranthus tricolor]|uniref:uncharacterized protein LOC130815526 n=1 Tax=Amaranthus tricolor TaxID=29722 RepID=UPI00258F8ED0|nr:uncharacterized protein LOC130815526 [Amaranthus tricolor]
MSPEREVEDPQHDEPSNINDGIQELLSDALREGPNEEAKKFFRLKEEGEQELYPGCKKMSRLAFTIRLYIYKCDHKLSDVATAGLLNFFKEVLPDDAILPTSMHEAKKVLKLLGLDYKRIDACPNDCMLYWAEHANATSCHVCGTSRWKSKDNDEDDNPNEKTRRIPSKVLRYFPIKKRLQRLYMCAETANHPWRYNKRNFNGHIETRNEPVCLTGSEVEELTRDFPNEFGKRKPKVRQDTDGPNPWRKIPIFFKLPYWKNCDLRHSLDVMHIEKNMFDNVIGTLLDIPGKSKDHKSAHRDLKYLREEKDLRWVPELEVQELEDGSEEFPTSMFWMNDDEKKLFCQTIKNAKLPQGYASNISRCVQVDEKKIIGYKSHDAHFMMHYLLPIAAKTTLRAHVATPIIGMSKFFKGIWKKSIDPKDLDNL